MGDGLQSVAGSFHQVRPFGVYSDLSAPGPLPSRRIDHISGLRDLTGNEQSSCE